MALHFVNFREGSETWHRAVRLFGAPSFVHRRWDVRAKFGGEFDATQDVFVFAKGTEQDEPSPFSFDDSAVM